MKIENNQSYYLPTAYECIACSFDVYKYQWDSQSNTCVIDNSYPPLPAGWQTYLTADCNDTFSYFGACYVKYDPHPCALIIANRGTVFKNKFNLLDDIRVAIGNVPIQFNSAETFMGTLESKMKHDPEFRDYLDQMSITYTGHSLGAVISDLLMVGPTNSGRYHSITFDSPGSDICLRTYLKQVGSTDDEITEILTQMFPYCKSYLSNVNLFNACNFQFGKMYRLKDMEFDYAYDLNFGLPTLDISHLVVNNKHYLHSYTFDQHSSAKILAYLKENKTVESIIFNPFGFQNGYINYLTYNLHQAYWDGYFDYIWNRDDINKKKYHDDKQAYLSDCLKILERAHGSSLLIQDSEVTAKQNKEEKQEQEEKETKEEKNKSTSRSLFFSTHPGLSSISDADSDRKKLITFKSFFSKTQQELSFMSKLDVNKKTSESRAHRKNSDKKTKSCLIM